MMRAVGSAKWVLICVTLFAVFGAPRVADYVISEYVKADDAAYDAAHPIAIMQGELISRTATTATVRIFGTKPIDTRRTCKYEYMQFFASGATGIALPIFGKPVDIEDEGRTKPTGFDYDLGGWELRPTTGAPRLTVFVNHLCNGRAIQTKITDLQLRADGPPGG